MDASSAVNTCIFLVDGNHARAEAASRLLKSKYTVVTAFTGEDALHLLLNRQHAFNMVLVDINLPDMSGFAFAREVVRSAHLDHLAVGIICDSYDQTTLATCRLSGAMLCLAKPLRPVDIENLWLYPTLRQREVMLRSAQLPMTNFSDNRPTSFTDGPHDQRKRKPEDVGGRNIWPTGQSSLLVQEPAVKRRFLNIAQEAGPSRVVRQFNSPGNAYNNPVVSGNLLQPSVYIPEHRTGRGPSEERIVMVPNPLTIPGYRMGQGTHNRRNIRIPRDGNESFLARYLENPHSREQLRRIFRGAYRKWKIYLNQATPWGIPAPTPVIRVIQLVVPISVPAALAQALEDFIHRIEAVRNGVVVGYLDVVAARVAAIGPPVSMSLQLRDEPLDSIWIENYNAGDIFDAIFELI